MSTPYPPSQPDEPQPPVEPQPTYAAPDAPPAAYPAPAAPAPTYPAPTYAAPAAPPTAYPAPAAPPTAYPAPAAPPTAYPQQAAPPTAYPQQAAYPQPGYGAPGAPPQPTNPTNTMAIVALICGIVLAPVGIVLGIIALSQIKKTKQGGRGLALAGVIIGALGTLIWVAAIAALIAAANSVSNHVDDLDTLGKDITVQASVVSVAMWAETVKTETGSYPTELSADAPTTGDVDVALVPSGADLCVQGELGNSVFHMINYGDMLDGAC